MSTWYGCISFLGAGGPTSVTIARGGVFRAGVPGPGPWTLRIEQHVRVREHGERTVDIEVGPEQFATTFSQSAAPSDANFLTVGTRPTGRLPEPST